MLKTQVGIGVPVTARYTGLKIECRPIAQSNCAPARRQPNNEATAARVVSLQRESKKSFFLSRRIRRTFFDHELCQNLPTFGVQGIYKFVLFIFG
jgi:hypothetical protein